MDTYSLNMQDRQLIQATQNGLPLTSQPYHDLAQQLGWTPQEVMQRLQQMLEKGFIRRIGVVPNHYALGLRANGMTVWAVPEEQVDTLGKQVGALEFVSHCYHRPACPPKWPYNLFAMVHGKDRTEVEDKVQHIVHLLKDYHQGYEILYSTRILKKTGLRLK